MTNGVSNSKITKMLMVVEQKEQNVKDHITILAYDQKGQRDISHRCRQQVRRDNSHLRPQIEHGQETTGSPD
jgi:hypothetical protein